MSKLSALEYARKYWDMEIPIINDENQIVSYEKVRFGKYRLYQGWDPKSPGGAKAPPGQNEWSSAVSKYALRFFSKKKPLELRVKNVWGSQVFLTFRTWGEFRQLLPRAVQAFSGKGSPEDVQLTLQLAARCGVAAPGSLQRYCDEKVDANYPRLGLDCNGFVGSYLRYRSFEKQWIYIDPISSANYITADMGIASIVKKLKSDAVTNEAELVNQRKFVLALVNSAGVVIDGGFGPVGHIMIIEEMKSLAKQPVQPPVPKQYLGGQYFWFSGVEATPAVGLSRIAYAVLNVAKNGVATIWRDEVKSLLNVKMYPVT